MIELQHINPMTWMTLIAAGFISITVLFNPSVSGPLKLATVAVMFLVIAYFLIQAGLLA